MDKKMCGIRSRRERTMDTSSQVTSVGLMDDHHIISFITLLGVLFQISLSFPQMAGTQFTVVWMQEELFPWEERVQVARLIGAF